MNPNYYQQQPPVNPSAVRPAGLMRIDGQTHLISRPVGGSRPSTPSRPATPVRRPGTPSRHPGVQYTATPGRYPTTLSAGMPSSAPSSPVKRGASDTISNLHKAKPYAPPPTAPGNANIVSYGTSSPIKRPGQKSKIPPAVEMHTREPYHERPRAKDSLVIAIPDQFIHWAAGSPSKLLPCAYGNQCLATHALAHDTVPAKMQPFDVPGDYINSTRPTPIAPGFCATYISFKDRRSTSPTALMGVSLSRLLTTQDVSIEDANDFGEQLGVPESFELMVRLNGFPEIPYPVRTTCAHGSITRRGLVIMLARLLFKHMQRGGSRSIVHHGLQTLPSPAKFDELRIVALYQANKLSPFQVDLFYVEKKKNTVRRK